jgi:hypothetical protein
MVLRGETPLGGYRYLQWGFTGGDALGGMYGLDGAEQLGTEAPGGDRSIDLTGSETCVPRFSTGKLPPVDAYFLKATKRRP